jgi:hypothetical protein
MEAGATGRPDELLAELGYETALHRITRLALELTAGGQQITSANQQSSESY